MVHLNAFLRCISQKVNAALESVEELPLTPRSNDLQRRVQGVRTQLKADLVVSFASRSMREELAFVLGGAFDQRFGDERPGNGGAQKVAVLYSGVKTSI